MYLVPLLHNLIREFFSSPHVKLFNHLHIIYFLSGSKNSLSLSQIKPSLKTHKYIPPIFMRGKKRKGIAT